MTYPNLHIEQLMFKKASGSISKEEDQILEAELANNAAARAHYEDILQTLGTPQNKTFLDNYDPKAGWKQIEDQVDPTHSQRISPWHYAFLAAALVLIVFSVWYYRPSADGLDLAPPDFNALVPAAGSIQLQLENGQSISLDSTRQKKQVKLGNLSLQTQQKELSYESPAAAAAQWATLRVPARQDYLILLPDGSKVRLNSMSSLRFPSAFNGNSREVYVQGEAYFTVAANAAVPFIVHTPTTSIRVLGTAFNVNAYEPGRVSTALISGKVALEPFESGKQKAESEKQPTVLSPGKEAVYRPESGFEVSDFEEEAQLSWMKGLHYFYNETLGGISPVLARWYGVSVVFDDPELATRPFSGSIDKSQPLQAFIDNLQRVARISPYIKDSALHFK